VGWAVERHHPSFHYFLIAVAILFLKLLALFCVCYFGLNEPLYCRYVLSMVIIHLHYLDIIKLYAWDTSVINAVYTGHCKQLIWSALLQSLCMLYIDSAYSMLQ